MIIKPIFTAVRDGSCCCNNYSGGVRSPCCPGVLLPNTLNMSWAGTNCTAQPLPNPIPLKYYDLNRGDILPSVTLPYNGGAFNFAISPGDLQLNVGWASDIYYVLANLPITQGPVYYFIYFVLTCGGPMGFDWNLLIDRDGIYWTTGTIIAGGPFVDYFFDPDSATVFCNPFDFIVVTDPANHHGDPGLPAPITFFDYYYPSSGFAPSFGDGVINSLIITK